MRRQARRVSNLTRVRAHAHTEQGIAAEPDELVKAVHNKYKDFPSFKFVFADRAPKALKKKLDGGNALKDYSCKLEKRSGHLYLSETDGIWFQHKLLGLVTKTAFPPGQIRSLSASGAVVELVLHTDKKTETHKVCYAAAEPLDSPEYDSLLINAPTATDHVLGCRPSG